VPGRLDPTWWRKAPNGYLQANARLDRLPRNRWALYIDGECIGSWQTLATAKLRAAQHTSPKPWETPSP
jgi:hypothetical protein